MIPDTTHDGNKKKIVANKGRNDPAIEKNITNSIFVGSPSLLPLVSSLIYNSTFVGSISVR